MNLRRGHLLVSALLLLLFAFAAYESANLSTRSRQFPLAVTLPATALAAANVVRILRAERASDPAVPSEARLARDALAWFAAFFAGVWLFGLIAALVLFAAAYLRLVAKESWPVVGIYTAALFVFTYGVFVTLLHLPIPAGIVPIPLGG